MVATITITVENSEEAKDLVRDAINNPNSPLLTPVQENEVYFSSIEVVDDEEW